MSLSITLLFYFFTRYYSFGAGAYALLVTLSSFMVWAYWVEARPYALWFFLTTGQLLLFLSLLKDKKNNSFLWTWLAAVHLLLAFTLILSSIQIAIASFLLWAYNIEKSWRKYFFMTVIPLSVCLFYYSQSMLYSYLLANPFQLIFYNIPPERIIIFFVYFIFWLVYAWQKKKGGSSLYPTDAFPYGKPYGPLLILMLMAALMLLLIMRFRQPAAVGHTTLSERYFLYLTPVGIIAVVLFSLDLVRVCKRKRWMLANVVMALGGLLIIRFLRTCLEILGI